MSALINQSSAELTWKSIDGYEGIYEISNTGLIKNIQRNKIVSGSSSGKGYRKIQLWKNKTPKIYLVHRLVAENFISKISKGFEINHINGIKDDNRVKNLEIVTRSENRLHQYYILKHRIKPVSSINIKTKEVKYYESVSRLIEDGFDSAHVHAVLSKKRKTHKGHFFQYLQKDDIYADQISKPTYPYPLI